MLALIAEGRTNASIARQMPITEKAVVQYASRIYDALGLFPATTSIAACWPCCATCPSDGPRRRVTSAAGVAGTEAAPGGSVLGRSPVHSSGSARNRSKGVGAAVAEV